MCEFNRKKNDYCNNTEPDTWMCNGHGIFKTITTKKLRNYNYKHKGTLRNNNNMYSLLYKMTNPSVILPRNSLLRRSRKALFIFVSFGIVFLWIHMCGDKITEQNFLTEFREFYSVPKYILLWNGNNYAPLYYLGKGSVAFKRCPVSNCFVTSNRNFFKGNLTKFDAIAFNGRDIGYYPRSNLPQDRSPHQKYIYFNMESAVNSLMCNQQFDGFFNWTATYKLNSDIVFPYLLIKNTKGEEVGPKINMTWKVWNDSKDVASYKSKGVMWLASHCNTKSKREYLVRLLEAELRALYLPLDMYGRCGSSKCPNDQCEAIIEKYCFYLSFENSLAADYVTEKVYTALINGVIPVVLGGADYSRFLPPGSYLDANRLSPQELASTMVDIIENPRTLNKFFWWRNHYTYHRPEQFENVCRVCAALNNKKMLETHTVYKHFRSWWNPNYKKHCRTRKKRASISTQDKAKLRSQNYTN